MNLFFFYARMTPLVYIAAIDPPYMGDFSPGLASHKAAQVLSIHQRRSCMRCPHCESENTRVIDTTHDAKGGIRRRRVCEDCDHRFSTYERPVLSTPLIIKRDNTREEFDKEKLLQGIRLACTKRPVSAEQIERLAGEIEANLQHSTKLEVQSQFIGDMVIEGLRKLDDVAYIRFASVYLPLGNLNALRDEIDRLLERKERKGEK